MTPQDLEAERSAIEATLHATGAIAGVIDGGGFYKPDHEPIRGTTLAMFNRNEPVEPLTVTDA